MILRRLLALVILALIVCVILAALGLIHPVSWLPPSIATEIALPTGGLPQVPVIASRS